MKINTAIRIIFLLALTTIKAFGQPQMTKDEILQVYRDLQDYQDVDSTFRSNIHKQTRATLDNLLGIGVDTLLVYSIAFPGSEQTNGDTCSGMYPVDSYFFWRYRGNDFIKKISGSCELASSECDGKVTGFIIDHHDALDKEFFMEVVYSGKRDGDKLRISGSAIAHEPKYFVLIHLPGKDNYLTFSENALENKENLFYDYNHNLVSFELFQLLNEQLKNK